MTEDELGPLEHILNIQLEEGTWDHDEYMFGMTNGMLCAYASLLGVEAEFKSKPEFWKSKRARFKSKIGYKLRMSWMHIRLWSVKTLNQWTGLSMTFPWVVRLKKRFKKYG